MIDLIKTKLMVYICLVHAGLIVFLITLFREDSVPAGSATFMMLLLGVGLMYSAFLFSVLSIWLPARPWIARYERTKAWHTWILHEIPTILALVPVAIAALRILKASWNEIKGYQETGDLNVQNLALVAQKFAKEAESLAQQPGVEMVKSRLGDL
jgi:hypothetical protein